MTEVFYQIFTLSKIYEQVIGDDGHWVWMLVSIQTQHDCVKEHFPFSSVRQRPETSGERTLSISWF